MKTMFYALIEVRSLLINSLIYCTPSISILGKKNLHTNMSPTPSTLSQKA
jgi:hypothetical protein